MYVVMTVPAGERGGRARSAANLGPPCCPLELGLEERTERMGRRPPAQPLLAVVLTEPCQLHAHRRLHGVCRRTTVAGRAPVAAAGEGTGNGSRWRRAPAAAERLATAGGRLTTAEGTGGGWEARGGTLAIFSREREGRWLCFFYPVWSFFTRER